MKWNWQQTDWPRFTWSEPRLAKAEAQFLVGGGVILGAIEHLDEEHKQSLMVKTMCEEAATTSEIEGEVLDRESVRSSIHRQMGITTDAVRATPAEQGAASLMVSLYQDSSAPLDEPTLLSWHQMLMQGRDVLNDHRHRAD